METSIREKLEGALGTVHEFTEMCKIGIERAKAFKDWIYEKKQWALNTEEPQYSQDYLEGYLNAIAHVEERMNLSNQPEEVHVD